MYIMYMKKKRWILNQNRNIQLYYFSLNKFKNWKNKGIIKQRIKTKVRLIEITI